MGEAVRPMIEVSLDEAEGLVEHALGLAQGDRGHALRTLALQLLEERAELEVLHRHVSRGYVRAAPVSVGA